MVEDECNGCENKQKQKTEAVVFGIKGKRIHLCEKCMYKFWEWTKVFVVRKR